MYKRIWQPDMVVEHILQRANTEPLNSHYYATTYPSVYAAAERLFGSWREAICACGFRYEDIRKYKIWSRERVLEEIRELQKNGESLSSKNAQDNHKSLYMASLKRCGSWGKAVQMAGVDYNSVRLRRKMTPEEVRREILALHRRGESLAYTNMRKKYQYLLAAGAKKLGGGSWGQARSACGIATNFRVLGQAMRQATRQERIIRPLDV